MTRAALAKECCNFGRGRCLPAEAACRAAQTEALADAMGL